MDSSHRRVPTPRCVISEVRFTQASPAIRGTGLIGWIACTLNGRLRLDGLALRRTRGGRLTVSFPSRHDGQGRQHYVIHPLNDQTRREIEAQIFAALGMEDATR